MGVTYSQFFPPTPTLTEANVPNLSGKVIIVTGGAAGIGFELCKILYQAGGKVYLAGRSEEKAQSAISKIKALKPQSTGELIFLQVSLDDLASIKPAVETFTAAETKLDVLILNAGVSNPPKGTVSTQGHEIQMATNCLGHYLLAQLLVPTLVRTAKASQPGDVRVVWTASIAVDLGCPQGGGLTRKALANLGPNNPQTNYTHSKLGNWFLAKTLADQVGKDGVLSVAQNPGNLKSELTRHFSWLVPFLASPLLHETRFGAYTELWAGFSPELTIDDGGCYILPWGRKHPGPRPDLVAALESEDDGGAKVFTELCEEITERFR